jgi:hypothetical protein
MAKEADLILEEKFNEAMMNIYKRAVKECKPYNPHVFLQMVVQYGGLETARRLLNTSEIQYGFDKLWEHNRLDLTMEFHVLQPEYISLFTKGERKEARRRLNKLGYDVDNRGRLVTLGSSHFST